MRNLLLREELVQEINIFNQIFELDFVNSDEGQKNWKDYLDPITKHLFNENYISFVKSNPLVENSPPGSLEKYFNLFELIIRDFSTLASLDIPNEIFTAATHVRRKFEEFLSTNKFQVSKVIMHDDGNENIAYTIYPTI